MNDEFQVKLSIARQRLPLERLMAERGKDTSTKKCPYCGKKGGGIFKRDGNSLFKCHHTSCPSGTAGDGGAWDQVGFLKHELNLQWKEAAIVLMKEAGVWEERERLAPSVMPGKAGRKRSLPQMTTPTPVTPENLSGAPETSGEIHQPDNTASLSDAPPPLGSPADCADAGSTTKVDGKLSALGSSETSVGNGSSEKPANDAPLAGADNAAGAHSSLPGAAAPSAPGQSPDEALLEKCMEIIRSEYAASETLFQRRLQISHAEAKRLLGLLEARGVVSPAIPPGDGRAILIELDRSKMTKTEKLFIDAPPREGTRPAVEVDGQSKIVGIDGKPVEEAKPKSEPPPPNDGYRVLREFYERLALTAGDEEALFVNRGLESRTTAALGFRSNPRGNKELLLELGPKYAWDELASSGLWLDRDGRRKKERRPNAQFCGAGIMRKLNEGEHPGKGQWADDDGNLWGWCGPILIPYVDETGRLIGLRPHKGGGRGETVAGSPKIYVPRAVLPGSELGAVVAGGAAANGDRSRSEEFRVVVITEGEFKAAALWQILGPGRRDGEEPMGVAALPGISFGKNYEIREELDGWLRRVKCRCVKVIYDNEEKGDPRYGRAFKTDKRKRFDAQIWARFLATDLAQKLHIRGEVGVLPKEWRNENGKADWDGAMAEFAGNFK